MNYQENDIRLRRERNKRIVLWISSELIERFFQFGSRYLQTSCNNRFLKSVPKHRRKQSILPDTSASWRFAKIEGRTYYDYDRLPDNRKEKMPCKEEIIRQYKAALEQGRQGDLKSQIEHALTYEYESYLRLYSEYGELRALLLAKAAAVVTEAVRYIRERDLGTSRMTFFADLAAIVDELQISYLPTNYRRLKQKVVAAYEGEAIEEVIKLPRAGNQNSRKYEDGEIIGWITYMRAMPQNYTGTHITRKLKLMCQLAEKKCPSKSWVEAQMAKPRMKFLTMQRFGSGRKADRMKGYMPVQNSLFAGDCWQVDGTRVNLISHKGQQGKEQFLYIISVIDVHSGDLIGWHFDTKEDRWGYLNALKMACSMTGYLPWEIVIDRFPGHKTDEWKTFENRIKHKGTRITVTSKKTGKAKVERMFSTLQTVFMQDSIYYYGEGVQSRNDYAHRSPEYLKKIQKQARSENWDFEAACNEANQIIEAYRSTKLSEYSRKYHDVHFSPRQLCQISEIPHAVRVEAWDYIDLFGLEKSIQISNSGMIRTEIQRMRYVYTIDDYETIRDHKRVRMGYDMDDLSVVYLYEDSDDAGRGFLCIATEQRAAQVYGPDADLSTIGEQKKRIDNIERKRREEFEQITEVVGDEVNLLMARYSNKKNTATAESRWLHERAGELQDKGELRILNQAPPEPAEEEEVQIDIEKLARRQY